MPPTLEDLDGQVLDDEAPGAADINARFAAAAAGAGQDTDAPPKREPRTAAPAAAKRGPGRPRKEDKARTEPAKPPFVLTTAQRDKGVRGLVQIGAAVALMAGKATGKVVWLADSITISRSAPAWGTACADIADHDAKFAAALDRLCAVGPYAALITAGTETGLQLVRNHRPDLELPGTVHPARLFETEDREDETNDSPVTAAA